MPPFPSCSRISFVDPPPGEVADCIADCVLFAGKPYSETLRGLALRKLDEVAHAIERFHAMRALLNSALRCRCLTLEQCARRIERRPRPRRAAGRASA